jgi:hypothetical protein
MDKSTLKENYFRNSEISGSQGGENEDGRLLG